MQNASDRYPSDLNDSEWQLLQPLLPAARKRGRPRERDLREILNGIFYLLRSGCAWRLLPKDFARGPQSMIIIAAGGGRESGRR